MSDVFMHQTPRDEYQANVDRMRGNMNIFDAGSMPDYHAMLGDRGRKHIGSSRPTFNPMLSRRSVANSLQQQPGDAMDQLVEQLSPRKQQQPRQFPNNMNRKGSVGWYTPSAEGGSSIKNNFLSHTSSQTAQDPSPVRAHKRSPSNQGQSSNFHSEAVWMRDDYNSDFDVSPHKKKGRPSTRYKNKESTSYFAFAADERNAIGFAPESHRRTQGEGIARRSDTNPLTVGQEQAPQPVRGKIHLRQDRTNPITMYRDNNMSQVDEIDKLQMDQSLSRGKKTWSAKNKTSFKIISDGSTTERSRFDYDKKYADVYRNPKKHHGRAHYHTHDENPIYNPSVASRGNRGIVPALDMSQVPRGGGQPSTHNQQSYTDHRSNRDGNAYAGASNAHAQRNGHTLANGYVDQVASANGYGDQQQQQQQQPNSGRHAPGRRQEPPSGRRHNNRFMQPSGAQSARASANYY